MIVVSDTSAITALLQIERAELLNQLYGEVLIPEAVREELLRNHPSIPEFIRCERVTTVFDVQRLLPEIDLGEAEAIVLAKERRADVLLIDDLEARRVAARERVPFIGLIGVLVQGKQAGTAKLEEVADFRLSAEVKEIAFRKAGE